MSLLQNGETVQWCGVLHWMVMVSFVIVVVVVVISVFIVYCLQGREIQTNCFLASYNNRNHSHL